MSDYDRSTTAMTLATLPEPIRGAVREQAEALQMTVADDAQAFLTHSRKLTKGGLLARMTRTADPDTEHLTGPSVVSQKFTRGSDAERSRARTTPDCSGSPGVAAPRDRRREARRPRGRP